jgi:hypothetical protein
MSDSPAHVTPKALAAEIGIDPKVLRSYLRKAYTRPNEAKNTTWLIPTAIAEEVKEHYASLAAAKVDADAPEAPVEA